MIYDNEFLIENGACEECYAWAQTQTDRGHAAFLRAAAEENFSYFTWCVKKSFDKHQSVEFAVYCAELALPIFERKFPDDERPRKAIAAARAAAADDAAAASAYSAAYAYDAAYAAYASAYAAIAARAAREIAEILLRRRT